jgi:hypothetical protein
MSLYLSNPPLAHIDDPDSVAALLRVLRGLHPGYDFAVGRWEGATALEPLPGRVIYRFVVAGAGAEVELHPGEWVRGAPAEGPYAGEEAGLARVTAAHGEALWPGDVICVNGSDAQGAILYGAGSYFDVITEMSGYRAPRLALLRNLDSIPGGCAAYPGAFRREALPPDRPLAGSEDRRGVNRVNEHTLDMRIDRNPPPIRHYHGPIQIGAGRFINHSETAIVLPRSTYNLPEVDQPDAGHVVIYRRPAEDPTDQVVIPVRPGSIIVTPATREQVMGHAFENCFAMLVAVPGFVAPYNFITEE